MYELRQLSFAVQIWPEVRPKIDKIASPSMKISVEIPTLPRSRKSCVFFSYDWSPVVKKILLTLPDLSLLLPTTLSNAGGSLDPPLTHEPFALTTSNLVGCQVYRSGSLNW